MLHFKFVLKEHIHFKKIFFQIILQVFKRRIVYKKEQALHFRIVTDCTTWLLSLWPVPQNFERKLKISFLKSFSRFSKEELFIIKNMFSFFVYFCMIELLRIAHHGYYVYGVFHRIQSEIVVLKGLSDEISRGQTTLLDLRKGGTNIRLIEYLTAPVVQDGMFLVVKYHIIRPPPACLGQAVK